MAIINSVPKCENGKHKYEEWYETILGDKNNRMCIRVCIICDHRVEFEVPKYNVNNINKSNDNICPFCSEGDFDFIGLKSHLSNGDCKVFNNTEDLKRI